MSEKTEGRSKAFKDYFDRAAARALAEQVGAAMAKFDRGRFVRRATKGLDGLEFAQRVQQFSDALAAELPESVPKALGVLTESLPPPLPDCEAVTDGWLQWPVGQFIADHGLEHFDPAMTAMIALTQRFSSEFAVRPFVEHRPDETFDRLLALTEHDSPHVRRWCSEGVRPRLPWGKKLRALVDDPSPIWPVLEALKDDEERYVTRSVANNLNDIAKDHPMAVVDVCRRWSKKASRAWLVGHALRSLIKDGDPGALAVVGFGPPERIEARLSIKPKRVAIGAAVELEVVLQNRASRTQNLLVDYAVHFVRSSGKASAKVFKWTKVEVEPHGSLTLRKKHPLKPTTIRTLFPGKHKVEVQVNGAVLTSASFQLDAA